MDLTDWDTGNLMRGLEDEFGKYCLCLNTKIGAIDGFTECFLSTLPDRLIEQSTVFITVNIFKL